MSILLCIFFIIYMGQDTKFNTYRIKQKDFLNTEFAFKNR